MSSKTIIAIAVAVVVVGGGFFLLTRTSEAPTSSVPLDTSLPGAVQENPSAENLPAESADVQTGDAPSGATGQTESDKLVPSTVTVAYTAQGFSPVAVTIKKGDTVRFVNESGGDMWVASAQHPTHKVYDGTSISEHCFTSGADASFDQCEAGNEYSFAFGKTGEWKYHDHVHPSKFGSIVVE